MENESCPFCDAENMEKMCIFPDPAKGDWKKEGNAFVVIPFSPALPGHCMIIPGRHVEEISELQPAEAAEVFQIAELVIEKLKNHFKYEAFTSFWLVGRYRTVSHFHLHIVPGMVIKSRTREEKEAAKLSVEEAEIAVRELREILS